MTKQTKTMETQFDLSRAIQNWRQSLAQSPAIRCENLDELETHLRDCITGFAAKGLSEEEALFIATRRLGRAEALAQEFGKVNVATVWHDRALWMLAGMLFLVIGADLASTASSLLAYFGAKMITNGFAIGWLAIAGMCITFAVAAAGFRFLASGRFQWTGIGLIQRRPAFALAGGLVCVTMLKLAPTILDALLIHNTTVETVGQTFVVIQWFRLVGPALLAGLLLVAFISLWRQSRGPGARSAWALALPFVLALSISSARAESDTTTGKETSVSQAMTLWRAGKKDGAVAKFLAVDFSKRPLFPSGSVLNYTEAQFIALPQAAREKMATQMNDDLKTIKEICAQIKTAGKTALDAGDTGKSDKCLAQLRACGDAFNQPDSLALLKLVGKALQKMAVATPK